MVKSKNISEGIRWQMVGMFKANINLTQISLFLNVSRSCVSRNIKKYLETGTIIDKKKNR